MDYFEDTPNSVQPNQESAAAESPNTYPPVESSSQSWSSFAWNGQPQSVPEPRRESPFANSPYVRMVDSQPAPEPPQPEPSQPTVSPQPPVEEEKPEQPPKSKSFLPVAAMIMTGVALFMLMVTFLISSNRINDLKEQHKQELLALSDRIEQLEDEANAPGSNGPSKPQSNTQRPVATPDSAMTPAQVYEQCADSVVAINCTGTVSGGFGPVMETASSGSGFILSADGFIVTNFHVVEGQQKLEVITNDGTKYEAEYIGGNEANDIALIKVDSEDLPPVYVGSSADLVVGDQVVAIGNPLGELASTLTVGYISAKDRIVTSEGAQINMLQTDAAINPGNSGGPLFNMYGQVVGITSAKYSGTTNSGATIEGIGFAIPMDDVMNMFDDLRNYGYITGGYLGVSVSEVGEDASELYGLPKGVLVREVNKGSCAEAGGIQVQDIIVNLGGHDIENLNDLTRALNKYKGGEEVSVTVYRSGAEKVLSVVLDERPQETEPEVTEPVSEEQYFNPYNPWPGDDFFDDWFGNFFG